MSSRKNRLLALAPLAVVGLFVAGVAPERPRDVVPRQPASARYVPPAPLPEGALGDAELRRQLIASRQASCANLELIAGVLVSTGVLPQVPPMISSLTGMPIAELEARETRTCQQLGEVPDAKKTTAALLDEANSAQWLVQIHLGAMDRVMLQEPHYRPVAAQGCFAAFFEMHDQNVAAMRQAYLAVVENPTVENGRALGEFWTSVLQPHARAENQTLWDLARYVARLKGNPFLARSADLVEAEHATIDKGIARYLDTLAAVERGDAEPKALVPLAEDLRIRTELHFGKEEVTVVRPLQELISSAEFKPVMLAFDREIGGWLRQRGWSLGTCG